MTNIETHIKSLKKAKLSTIIRTKKADHALKILRASADAGIKFIEVTLTIDNALEVIREGRKLYPNTFIGAGTVLTLDQAKQAIAAGAQYLVSPTSNPEIATWSLQEDILYLPGVLTPNEMQTMNLLGIKNFKLFPANSVPLDFIKLIKNCRPMYNFLATGGINATNMADYLKSGAMACGVTADLGGADESLSYDEIFAIAQKYVAIVKNFQTEIVPGTEVIDLISC